MLVHQRVSFSLLLLPRFWNDWVRGVPGASLGIPWHLLARQMPANLLHAFRAAGFQALGLPRGHKKVPSILNWCQWCCLETPLSHNSRCQLQDIPRYSMIYRKMCHFFGGRGMFTRDEAAGDRPGQHPSKRKSGLWQPVEAISLGSPLGHPSEKWGRGYQLWHATNGLIDAGCEMFIHLGQWSPNGRKIQVSEILQFTQESWVYYFGLISSKPHSLTPQISRNGRYEPSPNGRFMAVGCPCYF